MTSHERVTAMLTGQEVDQLPLMPITMMFAGDQIGALYGEYARDHRVLAHAQLRTAERFAFDYVSAISDPAREAADLGARIEWFDNQPPAIVESDALLSNKSRLQQLPTFEKALGARMTDRLEAVRTLAERVSDAMVVEGWVEGPCALAADLRGVNTLMLDFYDDPQFVEELFRYVVDFELVFARAQVAAGATLIGVGDAAASLIGPRLYTRFVLPFEQKLVAGIRALGVPVRLHICGNTRKILTGMGKVGADIVDLDFLAPLEEGRQAMGPAQVLLGNIDPVRILRNGTSELVSEKIAECHRAAAPRYIVGAGCEVPRGTPEANLQALAAYAHNQH